MVSVPLKTYSKKKLKYKCPDCPLKFSSLEALCKHVENNHKDLIPDNVTVKQYIFNRKYNKTHGSCVICKKETKWNEDKGHYERYCSEKCKSIARKRFKKNAKKKLGTYIPAATPEHQIKAIKNRRYSGEYKFKDGGIVGYSSSYEKDFLELLDNELNITSKEVEQCHIIFYITLNGKKRFHIPDYYMSNFNLIINIKDGGDNPNMNTHVQTEGRLRQKLADAAIVKDGNYNYIKIVNKEYADFINMIEVLKQKNYSTDSNSNDIIISIPE